MGTIKNLFDKVSNLDLRGQVPEIVKQTSYEIEALNKEQLYNGEDSEGYELAPPYSNKYYSRKKRSMNSKPGAGIPDLFLTGSFYKGFGVLVDNDSFEVDSVDSKSEKLKSKYGKKIFGLQQKNKTVYSLGVFFNGVKDYIEQTTGLKFK